MDITGKADSPNLPDIGSWESCWLLVGLARDCCPLHGHMLLRMALQAVLTLTCTIGVSESSGRLVDTAWLNANAHGLAGCLAADIHQWCVRKQSSASSGGECSKPCAATCVIPSAVRTAAQGCSTRNAAFSVQSSQPAELHVYLLPRAHQHRPIQGETRLLCMLTA